MIARLVILTLIAAATFPKCSWSDDSTAEKLDKAKDAIKKSHFDVAITLLSDVIRADPKRVEALYLRGKAYQLNFQTDRAIEDFAQVISLDAKHALAWFDRGELMYTKGEWKKATSDFSEAARLQPRNADFVRCRGMALYEDGDFAHGIADYKESIRLNDKSPVSFELLAKALSTCPEAKLRDGAKAVEYATLGCKLSEWMAFNLLESLSAAYAESGKFEEAAKWQNEAIALIKDLDMPFLLRSLQTRLEKFKAKEPLRYRSNNDWLKSE